MPDSRPRRLLRGSKACDYCHNRRIKCQISATDPARCQNCADFDIECKFTRPSKRAKASTPIPKTGNGGPVSNAGRLQAASARNLQPRPERIITPVPDNGLQPLSPSWQRFAQASTPVVRSLLALYQQIVHPIFPFFDSTHLADRLEQSDHVRNRAFFCSVMAACAITSARLRDGASRDSASLGGRAPDVIPETFYSAAEEAMPDDLLRCQDFDYLRAFALLAIASIQDAQITAMHKYIGQYFTMLAINQWHDESRWPQGLQAEELEERRRMYWSMYTLDVFSSIVWDGCVHSQEGHARVRYPSPLTVEPMELVDGVHWIVGWNFTTDLYRILEHDLGRLRSRSSKFRALEPPATVASQDIVAELYSTLPVVFKQVPPATGDPNLDIYAFQAANIKATMALLRMVYLTLDEDVDLDKKCSVVSDVLTTFHQVPQHYLRAISTPLIYHIGGIGTILGSVMEGPLSQNSCLRVRDLLLSMAALIENLESFLHRSAGAGDSLRRLVTRLEEYMRSRETMPARVNDHAVGAANAPAQQLPDAWGNAPNVTLEDLSPQFQLPEELFQDWDWPFNLSNHYLSFQPLQEYHG